MAPTCHCPETSYGMLPVLILTEAVKGNSEKVMEWLKNGGDINATEMGFKTLVHIACEGNYIHLLKELLKFPGVHINQGTILASKARGKGMTPFSLAMERNHVECVEALLSTPSQCKIDLVKKTVSTENAIRVALSRHNWKLIEILLNAGLVLGKEEATSVLDGATRALVVDVIKIIIDRDFPLLISNINSRVFTILYYYDLWYTVGAEKLFKQCFRNKNYWCFRVLPVAMDKKDFNMLEYTLKLLIPNVKININIAKAIIGKEFDEVEKALNEEDIEDGVIFGAIFIAAISGTTDDIAEELFSLKESYPEDFLKYVLLMASLFNRSELFPLLLKEDSFTYSTLAHALFISETVKGCDKKLIESALKIKSEDTILPAREDTN
ncbi:uncharacterized protein [Palaemon carinicauda]|uniref:uncharacterized protein n=1 Tax=Palaemon carinicauda TaxID=392227 RepID=UPI0035B66B28